MIVQVLTTVVKKSLEDPAVMLTALGDAEPDSTCRHRSDRSQIAGYEPTLDIYRFSFRLSITFRGQGYSHSPARLS